MLLFRSTLLLLLISFTLGCASLMSAVSGPQGSDQNHGKRTLGSKIEDYAIEIKAGANLRKAMTNFHQSHIVVVSFNGITLLLGQVTGENQRNVAVSTVKVIRHVRTVHDRLTVGEQTTYHQRLADTWQTYKIKSKLLFSEGFPSNQVKVITENGVVYLMGLLTEKEAERATAISRRVKGVKKVVKVFEFIS